MKGIYLLCLPVFSTIFLSSVSAEDMQEATPQDIQQEADIYMEEITSTCRAEAEGMDNAEAYVNECIKNMKQGFAGSN